MGGGILQLAAFGSQDIVLVGSPQITFFKQVFKRHSPFAIESIEQTFNGEANFGQKVTTTISRTGDLVTRMYLEVTLPDLDDYTYTFYDAPGVSSDETNSNFGGTGQVRYVNSIGHAILKSIELEIGGFRVDRHVSEWLDIWHELTEREERREAFNEMIGKFDTWDTSDAAQTKATKAGRTLYVPLQFFMNRHPGLALPLICLQFHETRVLFDFRDVLECVCHPTLRVASVRSRTGDALSFDARFYVDYVYLDTEERRRFAQMPHELLIEQVQFYGDVPTSSQISTQTTIDAFKNGNLTNRNADALTQKISLNFSHPVKEIVWVYQSELNTQYTKDVPLTYTHDNETRTYAANLVNRSHVYADYFNYSIKQVDIAQSNIGGYIDPGVNDLELLRTQHLAEGITSFDVGHVDSPKDVFRSVRLLLNGTDRFTARKGSYFRLVNQYQHHTRVSKKKIYSYSFALSPEEHQPSGSLNMSRVDQAHFILDFEPSVTRGRIKIFALGYNILRIASGLAGIAYSG
jgi:hypothetical protein